MPYQPSNLNITKIEVYCKGSSLYTGTQMTCPTTLWILGGRIISGRLSIIYLSTHSARPWMPVIDPALALTCSFFIMHRG